MAAVAAAGGADRIGNLPQLTDGFSAALLGAGAIALAGAAITAVVMRTPKDANTKARAPVARPTVGRTNGPPHRFVFLTIREIQRQDPPGGPTIPSL